MVRKDHKALRLFCLGVLLLAACKKDRPDSNVTPPPNTSTAKSVYVVCEGSLGNGNAALSLYTPASDSAYEDVYKAANTQPLGDVFQSMVRMGDRLFLCVNNSDKIVVIDRSTYQLTGTISITKPRYILPVNDTKAYVSTLFSNKVYIINPQTLQVTGHIDMPGQDPEQMLLYGDKAFIATWDTSVNQLYVVDINTDQLTDSIPISGCAPKEMVLDKDNKLWLLSGNLQLNRPAYFTTIDPATDQVLHTYAFPSQADPLRPVLNPAGDSLYYVEINYSGGTDNNGIYRMPVTAGTLPAQPFLQAQQYQYFYAVAVDPDTHHIYVADPLGFTQKGIVHIYTTDGTHIGQFNTGVGPGHFYFD
jgi:YVTN family beta-propeller protein